MRLGILGPLEVVVQGAPIRIGGTRLRGLLVRLAVDAGRVVTVASLSRALWPDAPPDDPAHALQSLVSRLRKALPRQLRPRFTDGGYRLDIPADAVDLHRFERLVRHGRRAWRDRDPGKAARLLREALALWRGDPLADVVHSPYAVPVVARLRELRLAAVEDRVAADLELGAASQRLVAELAELVSAEPHRERLRSLQIRALDEIGRPAEALTIYEDYRRELAERLGTDPGQEVRAAHLAALRRDSAASALGSSGNLRAALTGFVGRETERDRLARQLTAGRLVTLVGPGGVGKTRLATVFAAAQPSPAWLIELGAVSEPADIAATVADGLGLREAGMPTGGAREPAQRLIEALSGRENLLILDNCEHVVEAAAELADTLLGRCAQLRVVATSREPLGIPGEALCPVPPLPDTGEPDRPGPAVLLFADRAAAVKPGFRLTDDNLGVVADICRRLDGLPLAIELAAARLRGMPLEQLSYRLADRFAVLTGGNRIALPRHQTLRSAMAWSWNLLDDDERNAAERLSVFTGPFGADAAAGLGVTVAALEGLIDKSLLEPLDGPDPRFRMLRTIREYGNARLFRSGGLDDCRAAHAAYFLDLAERAEPHIRGADQLGWISALTADSANLLAAFHYACEAGDAETALRLGAAMGLFWAIQGGHQAAATRLRTALGLSAPASRTVRTAATVAYLFHAALSGMAPQVELVAEPAEDGPEAAAIRALLALAADDPGTGIAALEDRLHDDPPWTRAMLWLIRSFLHSHLGDTGRAGTDLDQAIKGFRLAGERWGLVTALLFRAYLCTSVGEFETAVAALRESDRPARDLGIGDRQRVWLAMVRIQLGDLETARGELAAVVLSAESPHDVCMARLQLADLARMDGDFAEAGHELKLAAKIGDGSVSTRALLACGRGRLAVAAGDPSAVAQLAEALRLATQMPDMTLAALAGVGVAAWRCRRGDGAGAARVLGAAHVLRGAPDESHPDIVALTTKLRAELGERGFCTEYDRGRGLGREAALEHLASELER